MPLEPRTKKIIIILLSLLIVIGAGAWFFFFQQKNSTTTSQISAEVTPTETPDEIRVRHMRLIEKGVNALLQRGQTLPLPQKSYDLRMGEIKIGYQGVAGDNFYDAIGLTYLLDPVTQLPYNYYVSADATDYKIFAYVNEEINKNNVIGDKFVFSVGTKGDFLLSTEGFALLPPGADTYILNLLDTASRTQVGFKPLGSCQEIYALIAPFTRVKSGPYVIDMSGRETKVYCDMQTDGGGWTLFYANNGHEDSPIAKSYVQMRETMTSEPVLDLSLYDEPNLAGLLDYSYFITLGAKEILIKNRTGDPKKWVKFSFSTSRALEWALGPSVLGKTQEGCLELPRRATWSIVSNDKNIVYDNLTHMMNHGGTSWGVSHEKYLCNAYEKSQNAHIGFYNANSPRYTDRTRSNEGIGGAWGAGGEYRYFIRGLSNK